MTDVEEPPPEARATYRYPTRTERARAEAQRRWRRRAAGDRPRGEIHDRLIRARERRAEAEQAYVDYWRKVTGWRPIRVAPALLLVGSLPALLVLSSIFSSRIALAAVAAAYLVPPLVWRANRTVEGLALWLWRVQRERELPPAMARLVGRGLLRSEGTRAAVPASPDAIAHAPQKALFHAYLEALERAVAGTPTGREALEPDLAALADPLLRRYWTVQLAVLDGVAARAAGGDPVAPLVAVAREVGPIELSRFDLVFEVLGPRWAPTLVWLVILAVSLLWR